MALLLIYCAGLVNLWVACGDDDEISFLVGDRQMIKMAEAGSASVCWCDQWVDSYWGIHGANIENYKLSNVHTYFSHVDFFKIEENIISENILSSCLKSLCPA